MTLLQEIEKNAEEIRRVLTVPTHTDLSLMFGSLLQQLDQMMSSLSQPIGAIIAWHKTALQNMPPLPPHWLECNGQTVNDPTSPFHELTLPDLNTTNVFLRGNTASGATGGATTHSHEFSGTTGPENISVPVSQTTADVNCAGEGHTHGVTGTTDTASSLPPHFEVVWIIRIK